MRNIVVFSIIIIQLLVFSCNPGKSIKLTDEGYLDGADGAAIYYRVVGSKQDTIVLVHGGPGAGMHSFPSVMPLAKNFTLIFYDQRGGGLSELPADTSKLHADHFVEDLEAVRRHFGMEKMNIIAHSFGSVLVARYAQKYSHRPGKIVFHAATGPRRSAAAEYYRAAAAASLSSPDTTLSNRAAELLRSLLTGTASDPVETCREYEEVSKRIALARGESVHYRGTTCNAPPEAIRYYYRYTAQLAPRYFGDWDFTSGLEEVEAPLLVVYGKLDTLGIPMQREWAHALPDGRLLLVPEAGKGPFSDNPDFVFPAISDFFNGYRPDAAIIEGGSMQYEQINPDGELQKIKELRRRDMEAAKSGDYETLCSLLTPDAVMMPPDSPPIRGAGAMDEHYKRMEETMRGIEILEYEMMFEEVKIAGNYAFEWGTIYGKGRNRENVIQEASYKVMRILKKTDDGEWKVHRAIWNSNPL